MNGYKKLFKNQDTRLKILQFMRFIPDMWMIPLQYKIKTGNRLNLKNPKRYTEKLQWYKLHYRKPIMTKCSDKYSVREYIKKKGYENILNELYGVYDNADDINFDDLPNCFAIKMTVGSGMNAFIQDKRQIDTEELRIKLKKWMKSDSCSYGREWCYYNIKPRIVIEKLLSRDQNNDLPDYKFFCFDGNVYCLYTMIDYTDDHENGKIGFFDENFNILPYYRLDFKPILEQIPKPKNFKKMIEIASDLSKGFPHVRVDLYNLDGDIVFGELTFYNASGYTKFDPDEFDFIMGEQFKLPISTEE